MVVEAHALAGQSVKMGRPDMLIAIAAKRILALLVGNDKQDIGTILIFHGRTMLLFEANVLIDEVPARVQAVRAFAGIVTAAYLGLYSEGTPPFWDVNPDCNSRLITLLA